MNIFSKFYKKTRTERIELLHNHHSLSQTSLDILEQDKNLSESIAGKMSENHLGTFALPFSILPQLLVDGQYYSVPMVTEEPSVVAAASHGAKIIEKAGGCHTYVHDRTMIGQVALYNIENYETATKNIIENKETIIALANQAYPSIVKRGGGAKHLTLEKKEEFLILYLHVDVQEAMGANILNTMLEAIKKPLEQYSQGLALMGILSNYATESLVTAECSIPIKHLAKDPSIANETAQRIMLASRLAKVDPYRAATHNKGIFNGVDAVLLATGNDWRAIEAAAHAYASQNGHYQGLSNWTIEKDYLKGTITLPLPVATVGGSIGLNPKVTASFELLGYPNAKKLATIIASLALCQNLAALLALVTSGIQAGHMKLHIQSLALLAGATETEIDSLSNLLYKEKHRNLEKAKELLNILRQK